MRTRDIVEVAANVLVGLSQTPEGRAALVTAATSLIGAMGLRPKKCVHPFHGIFWVDMHTRACLECGTIFRIGQRETARESARQKCAKEATMPKADKEG